MIKGKAARLAERRHKPASPYEKDRGPRFGSWQKMYTGWAAGARESRSAGWSTGYNDGRSPKRRVTDR